MASGAEVVSALARCGTTHVVYIPDSEIGQWDAALSSTPFLKLVRPTREGEAIAIAAGLWLGGAKPLVLIQCTGLFEAGDSLRNFVHDLQIPLPFLIGLRSYRAHQAGRSVDTCPVFTEPILRAWQIPYSLLNEAFDGAELEAGLKRILDSGRAGALVLTE